MNRNQLTIVWVRIKTENNVVLQEDEKITVYASFYPYYEFARNVAGDSAIVKQYIAIGSGGS